MSRFLIGSEGSRYYYGSALVSPVTLPQDGLSSPPRWGRFFWLCWISISKSGR
jgi:hypothetical protein